jgi:copper chaperone CopZ
MNKNGEDLGDKMVKIVLKVDGMMCGMCESHINDAVRAAFAVKKVTSSHTKGQTVIIAEQDIDEDTLREVIDKTGYTVLSVTKEPYVKKGLFSFGK